MSRKRALSSNRSGSKTSCCELIQTLVSGGRSILIRLADHGAGDESADRSRPLPTYPCRLMASPGSANADGNKACLEARQRLTGVPTWDSYCFHIGAIETPIKGSPESRANSPLGLDASCA